MWLIVTFRTDIICDMTSDENMEPVGVKIRPSSVQLGLESKNSGEVTSGWLQMSVITVLKQD